MTSSSTGGPEDGVGEAPGRLEGLELVPELAREQVVDGGQHLRPRAVVLGEREHAPRALAPLAEDLDVGVPESIDRLELVADEEQLLAVGAVGQQVDDLALEPVRVLELVDHDRAEAPALPLAHPGVVTQQVARRQLEVFEVECRLPVLAGTVGLAEALEQLLEQVAVACGELVQRRLLHAAPRLLVADRALAARLQLAEVEEPFGERPLGQELERARRRGAGGLASVGVVHETLGGVLQLGDPFRQPRTIAELEDERPPGRPQRVVHAGQHPAQSPRPVGGEQPQALLVAVRAELRESRLERLPLEHARLCLVEDAEARVDPGRERMGLEEPEAEAVDRRDPRGVEIAGKLGAAGFDEPSADAVPQLAGGALRVGDDEERVDVEPALADGLGEALDQNGRLARPRARGHEDEPGRLDRGDLLRIGRAHGRAHCLFIRHIGARSHQVGHPASPCGSWRTSPPRMRPTNPRACSVARSIWAQKSSSSR